MLEFEIEMYKNFCKSFKLNPSDGYVLVKSKEVKEIKFEETSLVITLELKNNKTISVLDPESLYFYFDNNRLSICPNNIYIDLSDIKNIRTYNYKLDKSEKINIAKLIKEHFKKD